MATITRALLERLDLHSEWLTKDYQPREPFGLEIHAARMVLLNAYYVRMLARFGRELVDVPPVRPSRTPTLTGLDPV
jgi:hypothetical protein